MQTVIYAATRLGYCIQVIDNGRIIYEYTAGNHQKESQAVIDPCSPYAVKLRQLKRWAKQTAGEIAEERGVPAECVEHDDDLAAALKELDEQWERA